jgi:CheY-like chemotaxis protein
VRHVSGRSAHILIVDVQGHNRKLRELLLRSDGYQTRSATNGEEALASIGQGPPDLILLAMHDAEQASRAKTEFLANMSHEIRTPMNAVVGLADLLGQTPLSEEQADTLGKVEIASNALLAPLNDVLDLSKIDGGELIIENAPFDLRALLQEKSGVFAVQASASELTVTLDFATAAQRAPASDEEMDRETGAGALRDLNALVVDDSDINLVLMKRLLEMHGATAELAGNGLEAFERLQAGPHDFEVVLMDVQMPVLDGYAATQQIRSELKLTDLPIIAVTAGALSSHRRRADEVGMNDYLVKPFDSGTLVRTILRHVKPPDGRPSGRVPARPMAPPPTGAPWPEIEGIVSADVQRRLSGDFALFRSLLTRLLDEFSDVAIGGTPRDANALALCRARLHKLKGSAGMLGANSIQELAGEGEAAYASGDIARAAPMATRIAIQLQRLREHSLPAFLAGPI